MSPPSRPRLLSHRIALVLIVALAALVSLASATVARADNGVIPPNGAPPWSDPAHQSPLELVASQISSQITGRTSTVQCDSDSDWAALATQYSFDPAQELGFVPFYYFLNARTITSGGDHVYLSQTTCSNLAQFAAATVKPTKCLSLVAQSVTQSSQQRYLVVLRVKLRGRWVKKSVWRTRTVSKTVTSKVDGPSVPCYLGAERVTQNQNSDYWQTYRNDALALLVLAHESIHISQDLLGASLDAILPTSETDANCYGLQRMAAAAVALGDSPDDAQAIAEYAYENIYPGYQGMSSNGSPYWSADCRQGGPLDLTPSDNLWP